MKKTGVQKVENNSDECCGDDKDEGGQFRKKLLIVDAPSTLEDQQVKMSSRAIMKKQRNE